MSSGSVTEDGTPNFTTFSLFPNLPFELRVKIWNLTIRPRIILCRPKAPFQIPAILHVDRESRAEGLRQYEIQFWEPNNELPLYFNARLDTLLCIPRPPSRRTDSVLEWFSRNPAVSQIHHLAISIAFWEMMYAHPVYDDLYYKLRGNKKLETITILGHNVGVVGLNDPRLVVDDFDGRDREREAAEMWKLEMLESKQDHPEWNDPDLRFMRMGDK